MRDKTKEDIQQDVIEITKYVKFVPLNIFQDKFSEKYKRKKDGREEKELKIAKNLKYKNNVNLPDAKAHTEIHKETNTQKTHCKYTNNKAQIKLITATMHAHLVESTMHIYDI